MGVIAMPSSSLRWSLPPVCFAVLLALAIRAQAAAPPTPSQERIDRLIRQLGSDSFQEREAATRALARMGRAAVPALRRAARSPDLEVRARAGRLVRQFDADRYRALLTFGAGNRPVYCLAFSSDGR